jgi:hypothetical protein
VTRHVPITVAVVALLAIPAAAAAATLTPGTNSATARKATLATFAGTWSGHTRVLRITRKGAAKEAIGDGCCDEIIDLRLQLSHPLGTTRQATALARITAIQWHDRTGWSGAVPHVGEVRRLRLKNGVITETLTGTNYCNLAAGAKGTCGA